MLLLVLGLLVFVVCSAKVSSLGELSARASFYGQPDATGTLGGACGYGNVLSHGYGTDTAALSGSLFEAGLSCGACYSIRCKGKQWCLPGNPSVTITVTNFCPPASPGRAGWCNSPLHHFDLSRPAFEKIASCAAGMVPVSYHRTACSREGGIHFTMSGHSYFNLVLVSNVAGAGDVRAVWVSKSDDYGRSNWQQMRRNWGQNWQSDVLLDGHALSFQLLTSDSKLLVSHKVAPANWKFGQTFVGTQFP